MCPGKNMLEADNIYYGNNLEVIPSRERTSVTSFVTVLTGPNGTGKSSIASELLSDEKLNFRRIQRYTTKANGNDNKSDEYRFIQQDEFVELADKDFFVEWVKYGITHPSYYGTPRKHLLDTLRHGQNVVLDMQVEEALLLRQILESENIACIDIFISPIDCLNILTNTDKAREVVEQRMTGRGRENQTDIERRLRNVRRIIDQASNFTYFVTNTEGNLPNSIEEVKNIISDHQDLTKLASQIIGR